MKELGDLYSEPDEQDVLAGIPDFTGGKATRYFASLGPEDREVIQWYSEQGIGPHQVGDYISGLAKSYAIVDPERKNKDAIRSAHQEVQRVQRFLKLFLRSTTFFPKIARGRLRVLDVEGNPEYIEMDGWVEFASNLGGLNSRWHKNVTKSTTLPLFRHTHRFLDDPQGAPSHFNQYQITSDFRRKNEFI